ncbi:hypothetical protein EDB81DRAFT_121836 [Dactylonectria macrodidyma]|uniref:Transposable element Tc1 transposase n=1 Tax=Dactylonectria macrodidyma TaxID=307937 RepID=A0A9P9E8T6_9HYPO|nr:hypothetical protein EDB81DRAFT_121836 [Dactylonectria macrodidyma]
MNFTFDQWKRILWSDETWVAGGRHSRMWVTRRTGEEVDPTCVVDCQRKAGWMFWGCFLGISKGLEIFWEKDWGTINGCSYFERIVPVVNVGFGLYSEKRSKLMHRHSTQAAAVELASRGIEVI